MLHVCFRWQRMRVPPVSSRTSFSWCWLHVVTLTYPESQPDSPHWSPLPCVYLWGNLLATGEHTQRQYLCNCQWAWSWPWPWLLALLPLPQRWSQLPVDPLSGYLLLTCGSSPLARHVKRTYFKASIVYSCFSSFCFRLLELESS